MRRGVDKTALRGAVAFIHRFGSSLNEHVHLHVCVIDGVFEVVPGEGEGQTAPGNPATPPNINFHEASGESMRLAWLKRKPPFADASCAPLWVVACDVVAIAQRLMQSCADVKIQPVNDFIHDRLAGGKSPSMQACHLRVSP